VLQAAPAQLEAQRTAAGAPAQLVAVQIDSSNAERLLIGGPDAIGGIGDWYLANDRVEVVVDDPGRRHSAVNHGGTLVDAGVRGVRGEDQLGRIFPLLNLDQRVQPRFDAARAERDPAGRHARIVVSGRPGLDVIARDGAFPDALNPLIPAPGVCACCASAPFAGIA